MNPSRYSGRNRLSLAFRNKLTELWVSGEMEPDEVKQIVGHYLDENPEREKYDRSYGCRSL